MSAVYELENTKSELKGESYDKIRDYYNTLHTAAIRGIILFAEAYIEENNTYKSCISGYLSGIGGDFFKLYGLMDITGMENINQEYFAMIVYGLEREF